MHFAIIAYDKPGALQLRLTMRDKHRDYLHGDLSRFHAQVVFGGPLLSPDQETPIGTLIVIEADTIDAARTVLAEDPYSRSGLFDRVDIMPWRFAIGKH